MTDNRTLNLGRLRRRGWFLGITALTGFVGILPALANPAGASEGGVPVTVGTGTSVQAAGASTNSTSAPATSTTTSRGSVQTAQTSSTLSVCKEFQFLDRINALRASRGLPALTMTTAATDVARVHARNMAAAGSIWHSDLRAIAAPAFGTYNWYKVGENVGRGGDVTSIFNALVASSSHLRNMVDPQFQVIGIGVAEVPGGLYTSHFFGHIKSSVAVRPRPNCNVVSGPLVNSAMSNGAASWQFRPGATAGGMNRQVYAHPWGNRFLEMNCIGYKGCSTFQDLVGYVPRGQRYRFEAYLRCNASVSCPVTLSMWGLGVNPQEARFRPITLPANSGWVKYSVEGSFEAEHDRLRVEMYLDSVARNSDIYMPQLTRV